MPEKIFLTGFMASGKSTIGRKLALALNYHFIDIDELVEQKEAQSIAEIFDKKGESYFRQKELELLHKVSSTPGDAIISTGGGLYSSDEARLIMKAAGITFYVYRSFRQTWKVIQNDASRPLANNYPKKAVWILFNKRRAVYVKNSIKILNKGDIDSLLRKIVGNLPFSHELASSEKN